MNLIYSKFVACLEIIVMSSYFMKNMGRRINFIHEMVKYQKYTISNNKTLHTFDRIEKFTWRIKTHYNISDSETGNIFMG